MHQIAPSWWLAGDPRTIPTRAIHQQWGRLSCPTLANGITLGNKITLSRFIKFVLFIIGKLLIIISIVNLSPCSGTSRRTFVGPGQGKCSQMRGYCFISFPIVCLLLCGVGQPVLHRIVLWQWWTCGVEQVYKLQFILINGNCSSRWCQ